jgi:hypothetical protein
MSDVYTTFKPIRNKIRKYRVHLHKGTKRDIGNTCSIQYCFDRIMIFCFLIQLLGAIIWFLQAILAVSHQTKFC